MWGSQCSCCSHRCWFFSLMSSLCYCVHPEPCLLSFTSRLIFCVLLSLALAPCGRVVWAWALVFPENLCYLFRVFFPNSLVTCSAFSPLQWSREPQSKSPCPEEPMQLGRNPPFPGWTEPKDEGETLPLLWRTWPFPLLISRACGKSPARSRRGRIVTGATLTFSTSCLQIPVTISWEHQQHPLQALVDSGAAGNFMDLTLASKLHLTSLDHPLTVTALNGRPLGRGTVNHVTTPVL